MLTQIWAYILLWFLSKEICLWDNLHGLIKQDSCYLKHLITIESECVRFGYRALLYMWLMQCMSHANTVGSIACVCLFMKLWQTVKDTKVRGAFPHSTACVILDATHSTGRAISICWHTSGLLYRREQNADVPTCLICFKQSLECTLSVLLLQCASCIQLMPVVLPLHICVRGSHCETQSWKSPLRSHP